MSDSIESKLVEYMDAVKKVVTEYGTDAIDLGIDVARLDAIANVVKPLTIFILAGVLSYYLFKKLKFEIDSVDSIDDLDPRALLFGFALVIPVLVTILHGADVLNIWNWIGMFYPEAYLVHNLLF